MTLFDQALSITTKEDIDWFYRYVLQVAIRSNATAILSHLLDCGVSFKTLWPTTVACGPNVSTATLEFLLDHGWDINHRTEYGTDAKPFLWHVLNQDALMKWSLEHGASFHPRDQEPLRNDSITKCQIRCEQLLEIVAERGRVATFEFLRSKGAPLGWRPLHHAVEVATYGTPEQDDFQKQSEKREFTEHDERMAMVRYLIDEVGLDVNAPDQPAGSNVPMRNGTPICYIPASAMLQRDTRELTWLLLDRGADPTPALEVAKIWQYPKFVEDVKAWKTERGNDQKCSVQ